MLEQLQPPLDWPTINHSATGEKVRTIQYLLNGHGAKLAVDGKFSPATEAAVNAFKTSHNLPPDGVVGQRMWPMLIITVQKGSTGNAVRAVQSQMNTHGNHLAIDGQFGPATKEVVEIFQRNHPPLTVDGIVGPATWQRIVGPPPADGKTVRERIVANAWWGVANREPIHYKQSRPIDGHRQPYKLPLWTDCSGFATDCYEWAGAPDPNGLHYNGQGYTGTMLDACEHIPKKEIRPGDLVVFGPGTGEHVVIIVGTSADPEVLSHGGEPGPIPLPVSREAAYHNKPVTFLSATARRSDFIPPPPQTIDDLTNPATEEGLDGS